MTDGHSDERRLAVLFHESEVLGAGISVLRVLPELRGRGWRASGWFPGPGPLLDEASGVLEEHGQERKPIAFSGRGWRRPPGVMRRAARTPGYLRTVRRWLRRISPAVVHANSLLVLPEAAVARSLGLPVVFQVHELARPGRKRDVTVRAAAATGDVLVGVSDAVAEMLRGRAGLTPVLTVHNGVPAVERRARREAGRFIVGTVGYVSRAKGTDVFLRAAELALAERPDLAFEHVGQPRLWGDDAFDETIEAAAVAPPLRALRLLGRAPVDEALARWSLFVLSSRTEGFPLSTLQAMAAGVPVVATAVGGIPEQIRHLETGILVAPDDPAGIADWIVRLHDDAALRERLGEAAHVHVLRSFTLTNQAEGLARAYELAIRRAGARRRLNAPAANPFLE